MFTNHVRNLKIKLNKMRGLRLSEVAAVVSCVPGTDKPDVSPAYTKQMNQTMNRMIEFFGGDLPVEEITRRQYAEFHEWLAGRGNAEVTVNGQRRRSRAIWNRLSERGYDVCDIEGITKELELPRQRSKAISNEQLTTILEVASVRDAAILLYMVGSGIRRQTVPRLKVAATHIWQRPDGQFRIASKIPQEKTSAPRIIMAEHDAALAVQLWLNIRRHQDSPWLFNSTHDGSQLKANSINTIFRNLRKRAGLHHSANITAHSLRHKFAQQMLDDFDAKTVSQWMGINTETLLKVYAFRSAEELVLKRFGDNHLPPELFDTKPR